MPEPMPAIGRSGGEAARVTRCFLSFDFSLRRVGIAVGNTLMAQAQPLHTVHEVGERRLQAIERVVSQWQPDALVVGVPCHPDGTAHDNTARARRFARQLQAKFRLPVHEVDERYTTVEARSLGADDPDAVAAAIILQQFLGTQGHATAA